MAGPGEERKLLPKFVCDAMLGGLARWLRAAGYYAEFDVHVKDGEIVRKSLDEQKVMLTSDSGIMERYAVSEKLVDCIFIPVGLSPVEQLARVLRELDLPLRRSRCMDCNGELRTACLEEVRAQVPAKVAACCSEYFLCQRCKKAFWHGSHWGSITRRLNAAVEPAGGEESDRDESIGI